MFFSIRVLLSFLISLISIIIPSLAYADVHVTSSGNSNVDVHSESSGTSTTCINGNCTTTGGGGHATATINGKTY